MGVHGLTTYVEGNRQFFQDVKFRDSRLVIDGNSMYFRLYFTRGLDQQHGGDYDAFSFLLAQFFSALAACNIQPYVVLDGGMDPSDKKFSTLRQRLQSKIKEADCLSHGRNGSVLPMLVREVFTRYLTQTGVAMVQCPAEADWEIACLAHQWKCPVLTNDSDFYIFDLPGGYLPFHFFQWTNLNGKHPQRYISARRYTTNGLCRRFGGMNRELLPLCAVLAGNDYITPRGTDTLLALLDVNGQGRGKGKAPTSRIEGLLCWLSSFSGPVEALEEVNRLTGEGEQGAGNTKRGKCSLAAQLWKAMQEYHINSQSSLARWFSGGQEVQTSGFTQLPGSLSLAAAAGHLSPMVLDVLVMRRVMLHQQVENSRQVSSHHSALAIRQAIYGILLHRGGSGQGTNGQARDGSTVRTGPGTTVPEQEVRGQTNPNQGKRDGKGRGARGRGGTQVGVGRGQVQSAGAAQAESSSTPMCVEEYDRLDLNLKRNLVEALPPTTPLDFDTLGQAPLAVRLGVLLEVLGVKEAVLAAIHPHLKLAVGVTAFWLREAKPSPSLHHLQALLLGMVYGELVWNNQPETTFYQHVMPQLNWSAERGVLMKLDHLRVGHKERRGVDVAMAHTLSQWQACLWSALCLNQLLMLPLPEPNMSWVFSGSLVHGLLRSLREGRPAESFVAGGSLSLQLYRSLLDAVKNCNSKTPQPSSASGSRRKRGRRGVKRGGVGREGGVTEALNNKFALLMSEQEFDD